MTRLETSARSCTSSRQNSSKIDSVRGALQFCESNRRGATRKKGEAIYDIASLFDAVDPGGCLSKPHGVESLMATGTSSPKFGGRKSPRYFGEFRRNSSYYCLIYKFFRKAALIFFSPRAFSVSSNVTAPFLCDVITEVRDFRDIIRP